MMSVVDALIWSVICGMLGAAFGFVFCAILVRGSEQEKEIITLYDYIKSMTMNEMVSFFISLNSKSILEIADSSICRKCKADHGGNCPVSDDEKCLFEMSDRETIKKWLEGGAYNEQR